MTIYFKDRKTIYTFTHLLITGVIIILMMIFVPSRGTTGELKQIEINNLKPIKDYLLSKPKLEIQLQSGDFQEYGTHWKQYSPATVTFRWSHKTANAMFAAYEVRSTLQGVDSPPIDQGGLAHLPEVGINSKFKIDFRPIVGNKTWRPISYFVRVVLYTYGYPKLTRLADSLNVKVEIMKGMGPQIISLPRLKVTFEEINILDDSDNTSDGEFGFSFWLSSGNHNTNYQLFSGSAGTGESLYPNKTIILENPPHYVTIHAYGFDDDEMEFIPLGPFIILLSQACGGAAIPNVSLECPADSASGHVQVDSGSNSGARSGKRPFNFYATGDNLIFQVLGHSELFP